MTLPTTGWGTEAWGSDPWGSVTPAPLAPELENLSFEIPDINGDALDWTQVSTDTFGEYAAYTVALGLTAAAEGFEAGWSNNQAYFFSWAALVAAFDVQAATYSGRLYNPPATFEGFEVGWAFNETYVRTSAEFVSAVYEGQPDESFETGWLNVPYLVPPLSGGAFAQYESNAFENFETGWLNVPYFTTWGSVSSAAAVYSGIFADAFEGFEHVQADQLFGYEALTTGNLFTLTPHGLVGGQKIQFLQAVAGVLPDPLQPGTLYFVLTVFGPTIFDVATTLAGPEVAIDNAGVPYNFLHLPYDYWTTLITLS